MHQDTSLEVVEMNYQRWIEFGAGVAGAGGAAGRARRGAGYKGVRHRLRIMNGAFMSFLQFYVHSPVAFKYCNHNILHIIF